MYTKDQQKKIIDYLMNLGDNMRCFDCSKDEFNLDKTPAHWSSINNGIFICMECSGEHRGFGVNISYIRSITLDSLNKNQLDLLKIAGNKRLNDFLRFYSINKNIPKKQLYNSKIMQCYRKMVIYYPQLDQS
jgi:ADP-ribosylation factor GTPase-activating protein 1